MDLVRKASTEMQGEAGRVVCDGRLEVPIFEGLVTDLALALALAKRRVGEV
jgi:hypothetical protein